MIDSKSLRRLYRQLKRVHPELIGLGVGWRTKAGRLRKEPAIRLVVAKKRSKNSRSVRQFPKHIEIKKGGGQKAAILKIFTDVETPKAWVQTSFPLRIDGVPAVIASCYVSWKSPDNRMHVGVVTVGHALEIGGPEKIEINVGGISLSGKAFMRSDLIKTGLDVGIVELDQNNGMLPLCLPTPMNPGAAEIKTTIGILGISDTDAQFATMDSWCADTPVEGRALAYYETIAIPNPNGQSYQLNNVVMADGPLNMYSPGRSGSPWIVTSNEWNPMAVALQSHGNVDVSFREGLGTHLLTGLQWLNGRLEAQNCSQFSWGWTA